mgnify:CR=1 FL=1
MEQFCKLFESLLGFLYCASTVNWVKFAGNNKDYLTYPENLLLNNNVIVRVDNLIFNMKKKVFSAAFTMEIIIIIAMLL